jgi:hypothetical protein
MTVLIDLLNKYGAMVDTCCVAAPLALPDALRDFTRVAAAVLRDHENRIAAIERLERTRESAFIL